MPRHTALLLLLFAVSMFSVAQVDAQPYPSRTVRIVVPFSPGGPSDGVPRIMAPRLSEQMGQQVVIENRPGGATTIGMGMVAKSPADGYTIGVANVSYGVTPYLMSRMPYDTEKDFALVSLVSIVPFVLSVHPSVPARSIGELVKLAKARPGTLNYSSSGNGSATSMATELFKYQTGTDIVHVPYNGGGPALIALLSGQATVYIGSILAKQAHFKTGRLRPLGVTTAKRDPLLPDVPAIAEFVPGYEAVEWQGFVVPAGTPAPVIGRLQQEIVKSLAHPDVKDRFTGLGVTIVGSTAEGFADHVRAERAKWSKVIKAANIRIE